MNAPEVESDEALLARHATVVASDKEGGGGSGEGGGGDDEDLFAGLKQSDLRALGRGPDRVAAERALGRPPDTESPSGAALDEVRRRGGARTTTTTPEGWLSSSAPRRWSARGAVSSMTNTNHLTPLDKTPVFAVGVMASTRPC